MWIDQRGSEVLADSECLRLLALAAKEGAVGHLAWSDSSDRAPVLQPVNFVYDRQKVFIRLGDGRMAESVSGSLVAFEVDHIDREESVCWSVLVRGLASACTGTEAETMDRTWPVALVPSPGHQIYSIRPDVVTGRRFGFGASA